MRYSPAAVEPPDRPGCHPWRVSAGSDTSTEPGITRGRLEGISDGIMAVAITLLVLGIDAPTPGPGQSLWDALDADAVFLALPEAASAELAPVLLGRGMRVIDLSGAFRLRDHAQRMAFYPATAVLPDGVAYGLTEFEFEAIANARLLSNPGCYPTASLLGLLPLQRAGLLKPGADIVIDAKSGISGAGKAATERTHFSENHGSVAA